MPQRLKHTCPCRINQKINPISQARSCLNEREKIRDMSFYFIAIECPYTCSNYFVRVFVDINIPVDRLHKSACSFSVSLSLYHSHSFSRCLCVSLSCSLGGPSSHALRLKAMEGSLCLGTTLFLSNFRYPTFFKEAVLFTETWLTFMLLRCYSI